MNEENLSDKKLKEGEYAIIKPHPKAVVVQCGDPRFQSAFQKFVEGQLNFKPGEYIPLVIPGGISALTEPETLPKHFKVAKEQIEFFLDHFNTIQTVVLINHEDCKAYESLKGRIGKSFLKFTTTMLERQQVDLGKVMKFFLSLSSFKVNYKAYYARFKDSDKKIVIFEEVTLK